MTEAGQKALNEGKIESYAVKFTHPGYRVKVSAKKNTGVGIAGTEEEAFAEAMKDLGKGK